MHVVIVGSGVAGVTASRTIRESDPKARISVYTDENRFGTGENRRSHNFRR